MADYWKYIGTMLLPADLPTGVLDEWETTLKAEKDRILASLTTKIATEGNFQDRIADASSDQFSAFLDTVGGAWDADVIEMKQRVKLARTYPDWAAGINAAFGAGGYFSDRVTAKKNKFKLARYTLGVVGHRASVGGSFGVWNPASVGVLLLRGDTRPARYFDANDTFSGTLESVVDAKLGRLIAPSLLAETVYGAVMAKFANDGGLTTLRDNIITASNTRLDSLLNVALDATHKGGGYDVTFVLSWSAPDVHTKLTVTDVHP
jgi:hypothetical protein